MSPPRDDESPPDGTVGGEQSTTDRTATEEDPPQGSPATDPLHPRDGDRRDEKLEGNIATEEGAAESGDVNDGGAELEGSTANRQGVQDRAGGGALRTFVVDVASSALAVLLVGALLFAVSGVWPPMVAIESSSMAPHMQKGDLVFVMDEERFSGDGEVAGTGVVTLQSGRTAEYRMFQRPGDVIVYAPNGNPDTTPIIHRAMFYVEDNESWYDRANRQSVGRYSECGNSSDEAMPNCPAPHAGFITKGDANGVYDQVQGLSSPVKPVWVVGTAEARIPKLGCVRLRQEGCLGGARAAPVTVAATVDTGNRTAVAP